MICQGKNEIISTENKIPLPELQTKRRQENGINQAKAGIRIGKA